jgi:hypothetical protein
MRRDPQPRPLDVVATEIRRSKAETIGEIIAIGGLLSEAKDQLRHGQWLPWLELQLGYSARSAQNYMRAHKFASRYQNVATLKLTSTALYRLADSDGRRGARASLYKEDAIAAILAEAKEKRVDRARADEIASSVRGQCEAQPAGEDGPGLKPNSDRVLSLQPTIPAGHACLREKFAAAIAELETLTTKASENLVGVVPTDRLEIAADFLKQVAAASRRTA